MMGLEKNDTRSKQDVIAHMESHAPQKISQIFERDIHNRSSFRLFCSSFDEVWFTI